MSVCVDGHTYSAFRCYHPSHFCAWSSGRDRCGHDQILHWLVWPRPRGRPSNLQRAGACFYPDCKCQGFVKRTTPR